MIEKDKQFLENILKESYSFKDKFFDFHVNTKVSLNLGQLNFFQAISAISLAILGIGLGTGNINIDLWSKLASVVAIFLVIYTASLSREIIDSESNGLDKTEEDLNLKQKEIELKIMESFKKDDIEIFKEYIKQDSQKVNHKKSRKDLLYSGEFVLIMFNSIIFLIILSFLKINFNFIILGIILFVSYLLSFKNWSLPLIQVLSYRIIKK